jgi:hypothetical protein
LLPQGQETQFEETPLAWGTRMVVFRNGDSTVLRTPLRTEEQLKSLPSHTLHAPQHESNGVSSYTKEEIEKHRIMFMYLGNSMMPVTPVSMVDSRGDLRTYAVQELIDPQEHLPPSWCCRVEMLSKETRHSLLKLVRRIRRMVEETSLIPDLAGEGNVLISTGKRHAGRVYLVDVNNVQPVLQSDEWMNLERLKQMVDIDPHAEHVMDLTQKDLGRIFSAMIQFRGKFYETLHPLFLDEYHYPVADQSLYVLSQWERLLGITVPDSPFTNLAPHFSLRDWVVRNVVDDYHGGSPP